MELHILPHFTRIELTQWDRSVLNLNGKLRSDMTIVVYPCVSLFDTIYQYLSIKAFKRAILMKWRMKSFFSKLSKPSSIEFFLKATCFYIQMCSTDILCSLIYIHSQKTAYGQQKSSLVIPLHQSRNSVTGVFSLFSVPVIT